LVLGALDEYNYGNPMQRKKLHYFTFTGGNKIIAAHNFGLPENTTGNIMRSGVCRVLPAPMD